MILRTIGSCRQQCCNDVNHDVDVTSMWRRTTSKYRRSASVYETSQIRERWRVDDRINIDTDKLNSVTDYKWIIYILLV